MMEANRFGFRSLTADNFLTPDPVTFLFTGAMAEEHYEQVARQWANNILQPKLSDRVPPEIAKKFELARAPLVYAFFHYPLFATGLTLMLQAAELAVRQAAALAGAPKKSCGTFQKAVAWLERDGLIPADGAEGWEAARYFRNVLTHESRIGQLPPGTVLEFQDRVVQDVNALFEALEARGAK